ncbi:MAG: transcriptional regulator [Legionellaceae bacterium]|nr:transcriptional regulator [Legionellaceae bacterium]
MNKIQLAEQFSKRLLDAMRASGHHATRSSSGVDVHALVEITGYSSQICRKYLRGEAVPEPNKLLEIAQALDTTAGWLLFGEAQAALTPPENYVLLNKALLHYLLTQAAPIYQTEPDNPEVPEFLTELADNISQISADEAQSKQIIDLALSSATRFHDVKHG